MESVKSAMKPMRRFVHYSILGSVLALPIFLTHFRGIADGLMAYIGICFLIRSVIHKDWEWTRQTWVVLALSWWGWLVICTIPFGSFFGYEAKGNFVQAVGVLRFLIFMVALQQWVLTKEQHRKWLAYVISFCAIYIIANMLAQLIVGYNILGMPRYFDGTLTGPYLHPRAAAPLSRIILPVAFAGCAYLMWQYKGYIGKALTLFCLLFTVAIMILAGQRMPFILFILGLAVSTIWLKSLRKMAAVTVCIVPIIVLITAFTSPESFNHLVTHFINQMSHFSSSPYGLVYVRALVMGAMNPWAGLGYDAFRHACSNLIYFHGWPFWDVNTGDGGGTIICLSHPHNHYLQAFVEGGIPGLLLFIAMIISALWQLTKGLSIDPRSQKQAMRKAWCVGLFAACFIHEWPFASTSNFENMPLGGWFFLLLGMGLAYSWSYQVKTKEKEHDVRGE